MCSEDLEALQAHKIWKKAIMLVWRAAANHRSEYHTLQLLNPQMLRLWYIYILYIITKTWNLREHVVGMQTSSCSQ